MIAEHDSIKREVSLLKQLVEKSSTAQREEWQEEDLGGVGIDGFDDDDARSIRTP